MIADGKTFTFLSVLTGLIVVLYVGAAMFAMFMKMITWQDFSGSVGAISGLLLGIWLKGNA